MSEYQPPPPEQSLGGLREFGKKHPRKIWSAVVLAAGLGTAWGMGAFERSEAPHVFDNSQLIKEELHKDGLLSNVRWRQHVDILKAGGFDAYFPNGTSRRHDVVFEEGKVVDIIETDRRAFGSGPYAVPNPDGMFEGDKTQWTATSGKRPFLPEVDDYKQAKKSYTERGARTVSPKEKLTPEMRKEIVRSLASYVGTGYISSTVPPSAIDAIVKSGGFMYRKAEYWQLWKNKDDTVFFTLLPAGERSMPIVSSTYEWHRPEDGSKIVN